MEESINKGHKKGAEYINETPKKFKKRVKKWEFGFLFDVFGEIIWFIVEILI